MDFFELTTLYAIKLSTLPPGYGMRRFILLSGIKQFYWPGFNIVIRIVGIRSFSRSKPMFPNIFGILELAIFTNIILF